MGRSAVLADWTRWCAHLQSRATPVPLERLLPGRRPAWLWVLPQGVLPNDVPDKKGDGPPRAALDAADGIGAVALAHALPRLAAPLGREPWQQLLQGLMESCAAGAGLPIDEQPLAHQLFAGELALTLGYLLPELPGCRRLAASGRKALSAGLVELCDGEGCPHGRHLDALRLLLACWTRCRAMGNHMPQGCWSAAAQNQYEWLVRAALRATRADGTHLFSGDDIRNDARPRRPRDRRHDDCWSELFQAALALGGDDDDRDIAELVLPRRRGRARRAVNMALPPAGAHSEWGATAVLRRGWVRNDPWLAVAYPGRTLRGELDAGGRVLLSGAWELEVRLDGAPLAAEYDWEETCWLSDEEGDYLELQIELARKVRVQRHFFLAREDGFALVADAVLAAGPGRLEHCLRLPLGSKVQAEANAESTEVLLRGPRRAALVMPLELPEWRAAAGPGRLSCIEGRLELRQQAEGRSLFAPLFIDLQPRRLRAPCTWRRLTVGENLAAVARDDAVGYRVVSGRQQWLVYRALASKGNRTLLGHNLVGEFLVARFDRQGQVERLVEIE